MNDIDGAIQLSSYNKYGLNALEGSKSMRFNYLKKNIIKKGYIHETFILISEM